MTGFARSGLITAGIERTATGVAFIGPLVFDEETVVEEGRWEVSVDADDAAAVADALTDLYSSEYGACGTRVERKAAQRASAAPIRTRVPQARLHTPCPALWAGR
jgi:hypothetical protein